MIKKIIILFLLLFLVTACSETKPVCPDGTVVADMADCPDKEELEDKEVDEEEETVIVENTEFDPELKKLIVKGKGVKSYQYNFATSVVLYEMFFKGDKAKKVYKKHLEVEDEVFVDEVYFDLLMEEAFAVCNLGSDCTKNKKKYVVDFSKELPSTDPQKLLDEIPAEAKYVNTKKVNAQQAVVYSFVNDEVEVSLNSANGLVVKWVVYSPLDEEQEEYNFNRIIVNGVKDNEVTLSSSYS